MSVPRLSMALALAGFATLGLAEDIQRTIEPTPLVFSLTGADLGVFPVVIAQGDTSALSYDLDTGIIQFSVGNASTLRYVDPLFCFDLSGNLAPSVSLQTLDANGDVVISGFGLGTAFNYLLSNDEIRLNPPAQAQCFYRSATTGNFGLFGRAPAALVEAPEEMIHSDRFQTTARVSVEFVNLPSFLIPGEALTYQVVLSNEGTSSLHNVAFQELYPRNHLLYDSALTAGQWTCDNGGSSATCPAASNSSATSMRFTGLELPVGSSLTFNINREVHLDSLTSSITDLRAGVVAGTGTNAPFDVAERTITIIGEAQSLVAQQDASARAGELATIKVTALDANKMPVPFVQIDVSDDGGLSMGSLTEFTSAEDGSALFEATATAAGPYTIQFSAEDMGTTSASVLISAADPASITASAASTPAIADGKDTVSFEVYVEDQYQNPVAASLVVIEDSGGLNITSADPYTDINGTASFSGSSTLSGDFTVTFSVDDGITDSAMGSFIAGDPAAVVFEQHPTNTVEGIAISPPVVVRILDANGNWVETDNESNVQLRLFQGGTLLDFAFGFGFAENGEVVFDNLVLNTEGANYSLLAVGSHPNGLFSSVTSDSFVVDTAP